MTQFSFLLTTYSPRRSHSLFALPKSWWVLTYLSPPLSIPEWNPQCATCSRLIVANTHISPLALSKDVVRSSSAYLHLIRAFTCPGNNRTLAVMRQQIDTKRDGLKWWAIEFHGDRQREREGGRGRQKQIKGRIITLLMSFDFSSCAQINWDRITCRNF